MTEKEVAYIFGIASIISALIVPLAGILTAIIGLVENRKEKSKKANRLNLIGLILSIIFLGLSFYLTTLSPNTIY